jgi:hypothetical protein
MIFNPTNLVVGLCVLGAGSQGTSVPAGSRFRDIQRGIGGEATKSKTKGAGATPHACPNKFQLQNTK